MKRVCCTATLGVAAHLTSHSSLFSHWCLQPIIHPSTITHQLISVCIHPPPHYPSIPLPSPLLPFSVQQGEETQRWQTLLFPPWKLVHLPATCLIDVAKHPAKTTEGTKSQVRLTVLGTTVPDSGEGLVTGAEGYRASAIRKQRGECPTPGSLGPGMAPLTSRRPLPTHSL